ncbi:MAG: TetR/AcrR family transcriptional regulator [Acidimicrobiia bacterium]|nr:TetR/AcrR family transcriptional regulator [Acidimicrobiia bacterium]MYB09240.1 TetR/AcrR family transcriptional regulator [Acidimicrobiia bacterium]MYB73824.1 TetR/AcrR family transcriptional regulator [Acidimicrobiia bacterium]MYG57511.1 TetR/AcrR family transcriptional regulator [Acidimicrobiia bacterium]MYH95781.1 TetR/AcrR family transcriptional regulator [Acidimicrobiia bacterium]
MSSTTDTSGWRANPASESYDSFRTRIVAAAERAINEHGIAGMRISHVASIAGCTRQNIHRYYATKKDLVEAVLTHRSKRLSEQVHFRLNEQDDPFDRLIEGIMIASDIAAADHYIQSYYSGASADQMLRFITDSPSLRTAIGPVIDRAAASLSDLLRPGVEDREVTEWVFRLFTTELLWSLTGERSADQRRRDLRLLAASPFNDIDITRVTPGDGRTR